MKRTFRMFGVLVLLLLGSCWPRPAPQALPAPQKLPVSPDRREPVVPVVPKELTVSIWERMERGELYYLPQEWSHIYPFEWEELPPEEFQVRVGGVQIAFERVEELEDPAGWKYLLSSRGEISPHVIPGSAFRPGIDNGVYVYHEGEVGGKWYHLFSAVEGEDGLRLIPTPGIVLSTSTAQSQGN